MSPLLLNCNLTQEVTTVNAIEFQKKQDVTTVELKGRNMSLLLNYKGRNNYNVTTNIVCLCKLILPML